LLSIYNYKDFRLYLNQVLTQVEPVYGVRSRLAKHLGCQSAYVSQILNGNTNPSLEQSHAISEFLGHSRKEKKYFLILVQKARAATRSLREFFGEDIRELQRQNQTVRQRLKTDKSVRDRDAATYYGNWHYAAIHSLCSIPEFQNLKNLSNRLRLSSSNVLRYLNFLIDRGYVRQQAGRYIASRKRVHLDGNSSFINQHHANWRHKATESLYHSQPDTVHFSGIYVLSVEDYGRIQRLLLESISKIDAIVEPSNEETAAGIAIDLFSI